MSGDVTNEALRLPDRIEQALEPFEVTNRTSHRGDLVVWARNRAWVARISHDGPSTWTVTQYLDGGPDGRIYSDSARFRTSRGAGRRVVSWLTSVSTHAPAATPDGEGDV